jgi:hypothetical protein
MTDDQFWRIVGGTGIMVTIAAFKPQIMRLLHRLGYRDWREKPPPDKQHDNHETRS